MFDNLRPAIGAFFLANLNMALIFGAVVAQGGTPVTPELYGPIVFAIPALWWSGVQAILAASAACGAICNRRWPVIIGGVGLTILFLFFALAAMAAGPTGTVLVSMALSTAPLCGLSAWVAASGDWHGRG